MKLVWQEVKEILNVLFSHADNNEGPEWILSDKFADRIVEEPVKYLIQNQVGDYYRRNVKDEIIDRIAQKSIILLFQRYIDLIRVALII